MLHTPQRVFLYNTFTTILIRCVSFLGTQYCIRQYQSPITLGTNVQFELLMTCILFIGREGFRLAITNNGPTNNHQKNDNDKNAISTDDSNNHSKRTKQHPVVELGGSGVAWLTIPVTWTMAALALIWHLYHCRTTDDSNNNSDDYFYAGILYCCAAMIEGCAEPAVLYYLQSLSITEKASAEGMSSMVKTATTVMLLQSIHTTTTTTNSSISSYPLTMLGTSQIMYAITYAIILYGTLWRRGQMQQVWVTRPSPHQEEPSTSSASSSASLSYWHQPTIQLIVLFTLQSILKLALTEGDRILLSLLAGSYDQGLYALGSAYGGLAVRLLLQPLEETARLLYSRLAAVSATTTATTLDTTPEKKQQVYNRDDTQLELSYTVLVKIVLYIGLLFSCLAVNYTYVLLNLLAGRYWGSNTEAVSVLSGFCVYTAFLAGNGMTEAFVYGVSNTASDIGRLSVAHTVSGAFFAILAPIAVTRYGTMGLVTANCVTMLARTAFSVYFAAGVFGHKRGKAVPFMIAQLLRQMIPQPIVLSSFIMAFFGTRTSSHRMMSLIAAGKIEPISMPWIRLVVEHIGVGLAFGIGILSLAYGLEREFRQNVRKLWHEKND
jgi:oligosaccharide translocation protein RFT1